MFYVSMLLCLKTISMSCVSMLLCQETAVIMSKTGRAGITCGFTFKFSRKFIRKAPLCVRGANHGVHKPMLYVQIF